MKKILFLLAFAFVFQSSVYAQKSVFVHQNDGTSEEVMLSKLQKITFAGDDMVLHIKDGADKSFAINTIKKFVYGDATLSSIANVESRITDIKLYPNPSNGSFTINYELRKQSEVKISLVSMLGEELEVLSNSEQRKGNYSINFEKNNLKAGSYFIRIEDDSKQSVKKLLILKNK